MSTSEFNTTKTTNKRTSDESTSTSDNETYSMWEEASDLSDDRNSRTISCRYPEAISNRLLNLILTLDRRYKIGEDEIKDVTDYSWQNFVKLMSYRIQYGNTRILGMYTLWCLKYSREEKDESNAIKFLKILFSVDTDVTSTMYTTKKYENHKRKRS